MKRLTDEQRARAADPAVLRVAERVAGWYARRWPHLADELLSAAYLGLVAAAGSPDRGRGAFARYVELKARGRVLDRLRKEVPLGFRFPTRTHVPGSGPLSGDVTPDGAGPVGWEFESEDGVRALARRLPAHQAEAVVALFLACEVGGVLRRTDAKLRGRANRGLAVLREALASRGAA